MIPFYQGYGHGSPNTSQSGEGPGSRAQGCWASGDSAPGQGPVVPPDPPHEFMPPPPPPSHSQQQPQSQQQRAPAQGQKGIDAFHRLYVLGEEIGRGAFSVVHRCTNRVTGVDYAVKVIDLRPLQLRENFDQSRLRREVEIMRRLNHPNIIKLEEVFESPTSLLLVLEYAKGTELFDSILQRKRYSEGEARPIFEQVAHALGYLHSLNIVHRDIKPENVVLLDRPSLQGYIPCAKLLDFGLSKMIGQDDGSAARTFVGTPCYLAPEVEARAYGLGDSYGTKVDCWSLGAVLYVMLVARFPEFDRSNGGLRVKLDSPAWASVSEAAKHLIRSLMLPDPNVRLSIPEVLQHPWVTGTDAFQPTPAQPTVACGTGNLMQGMGRMALGAINSPTFPPPYTSPGFMAPPPPQQQPQPQQTPSFQHSPLATLLTGVAGTAVPQGQVMLSAQQPHPHQQLRVQQSLQPQPQQVPPLHPLQQHHHHHMLPPFASRAGSEGSLSGGSPHMSEQGSFEVPASAHDDGMAVAGGQGVGGGPPGQPVEVFKLTSSGEQVGGNGSIPLNRFLSLQSAFYPSLAGANILDASPVRTHLRMDPNTEVVRATPQAECCAQSQQQMQPFNADGMAMLPLLHIQHTIADSIELAHRACESHPEDADDIKRSAVLCRSQLIYTVKLLRKIEQTATSVVEMFPDLELAVDENEPKLAHDFFATVKQWVSELQVTVAEAQRRNQETVVKLHKIVTTTTADTSPLTSEFSPKEGGAVTKTSSTSSTASASSSTTQTSASEEMETAPAAGGTGGERLRTVPSSDMDVTSAAQPQEPARLRRKAKVRRREEMEMTLPHPPAPSKDGHGGVVEDGVGSRVYMSLDPELFKVVKKLKEAKDNEVKLSEMQLLDLFFSVNSTTGGVGAAFGDSVPFTGEEKQETVGPGPGAAGGDVDQEGRGAPVREAQDKETKLSSMQQSFDGGLRPNTSRTVATTSAFPTADESHANRSRELTTVLAKMRDVDSILDHLSIFWAQTEVVLDVLLQKSDHVERFVEFAHKPRLLSRFQQRMVEYKRFWQSVQAMCKHYTAAVQQQGAPQSLSPVNNTAHASGPRFYGFLKRSLAAVEMGEEGGSGGIPMSWAGLVQPPSS